MSSTRRIFRSLLTLPLLLSGATESTDPPAASSWAARVPDDGGSALPFPPSRSPPRLHAGCQAFLNDTHAAQPKLVGRRYAAEHGGPSSYAPAREPGRTSAACTNGRAAGYPCRGIGLYSMLDLTELSSSLGTPWRDNSANDIWGWADPASGREFALIGVQRGTAFVEITDPYNPVYKGALKTRGNEHDSGNFWRDVKTYGHFALIVSEIEGHGMQVFDLEGLLDEGTETAFTETAHYAGFGYAHNIFVNEETGYAYAVGTSTCSGGLHFVHLGNPRIPTFAHCYSSDGYTHDVQCVRYEGPDATYRGREICFASNENTITIVDVSEKAAPHTIVKFTYENGSGRKYTHQGWLTEDHAYFIFDDEADERASSLPTQTFVVDVRTLGQPVIAGTHFGRTRAVDHNLYVKEDLVYQANYRAGLNVLRIRDIARAEFDEVAYFDVYPQDDAPNFNGVWSNYPFFPSGVVIISGIEQGLFMLDMGELSPKQTLSPSYTSIPTATPTSTPTQLPTNDPTKISTTSPEPTEVPTTEPTMAPTASSQPSAASSFSPTLQPTATLSSVPSNSPSFIAFIRQTVALDSCPAGSHPIYDIPTCVRASAYLGLTNTPGNNGDDFPTNPAVCFVTFVELDTGAPTVWSRTQVNSNHYARAAWICQTAATRRPTTVPTPGPTSAPTQRPTVGTTSQPSPMPTTREPSFSGKPSPAPSFLPSSAGSTVPSLDPSHIPSVETSGGPTHSFSLVPSATLSIVPSSAPSNAPSVQTSVGPTHSFSFVPSTTLSIVPSVAPSNKPTESVYPSNVPSVIAFTRQTVAIDSCPSGSHPIYDIPTCVRASAYLGMTNDPGNNGDDFPTSPAVCFVTFVDLETGALTVWSKTQVNSNHYARAAWICKTAATRSPTAVPTPGPTSAPTQSPIESEAPFSVPSDGPSSSLSAFPSGAPSFISSADRSPAPTGLPSSVPSKRPTPKSTSIQLGSCIKRIGNRRNKLKAKVDAAHKVVMKACKDAGNREQVRLCRAKQRNRLKRQYDAIGKKKRNGVRACKRKFPG